MSKVTSPSEAIWQAVGNDIIDHDLEVDKYKAVVETEISKTFSTTMPYFPILANLDGSHPLVFMDVVLQYRKAGWKVTVNGSNKYVQLEW